MNQKKYRRKQETISGQLHDQLVMMDIEKGQYFALNPVATRIWELLQESQTVEALCKTLQDEFDVEAGKCRSEVQKHLDEMVKLDLIGLTE